MDNNKFIKSLLTDVKVELRDEFDRNFERKAFFTKPWEQRKSAARGSILMKSGKLRRSVRAKVKGSDVVFQSSMPYAKIHNEGGEITVTRKMKSFFWAMYYKSSGGITYNVRKKSMSNTKRNRKLNSEAQVWKNMALMKTGSKIKIPKRQFIGNHPIVKHTISKVAQRNIEELEQQIANNLKKKL